MTSAVAICNALEQVCSLAHLKKSIESKVPLRIPNSLLDNNLISENLGQISKPNLYWI